MKKFLMTLLLASSCGIVQAETMVLKGSSLAELKESFFSMAAEFDPDKEKSKVFGEAFQVLIEEAIDPSQAMAAALAGLNPEQTAEKMILKYFNGLTAMDVLTRAKGRLETKITNLESTIPAQQEAADNLNKIKLTDISYSLKNNKYSDNKDVIIKLKIKNGTDKPISKIYFDTKLKSENRSVPWLEKSLEYDIKGGLEPNEEASWTIEPNSFDWDMKDAPDDLKLAMSINRVDDAKGDKLWQLNKPATNPDGSPALTLAELNTILREINIAIDSKK